MSGFLLTQHSLNHYHHLWLTCFSPFYLSVKDMLNMQACFSSVLLSLTFMFRVFFRQRGKLVLGSKPQSWVCYSYICTFKFTALFLPPLIPRRSLWCLIVWSNPLSTWRRRSARSTNVFWRSTAAQTTPVSARPAPRPRTSPTTLSPLTTSGRRRWWALKKKRFWFYILL